MEKSGRRPDTHCNETQIVAPWRTSVAVSSCSGMITMCSAQLVLRVGRYRIVPIALPSCVRSTIILAPIAAVGHGSGANGSTPVRTEYATDRRRSGELNHYTFAKTLRRARYVRARTRTRCRTALWTPFRSPSRLPTHKLRRDISRRN